MDKFGEDWRWYHTVIIFFMFAALGAALGHLHGRKQTPPCHYGAAPRMVIEQDGSARVVCACDR